MTITLPPALDALVVKKMSTGLYDDAAEVVRDALRQMEARETALSWLKDEAKRGFDELDRGDFVEMDRESFMTHIRSRRQAA
jgi:putative addiction module CopG family antidote